VSFGRAGCAEHAPVRQSATTGHCVCVPAEAIIFLCACSSTTLSAACAAVLVAACTAVRIELHLVWQAALCYYQAAPTLLSRLAHTVVVLGYHSPVCFVGAPRVLNAWQPSMPSWHQLIHLTQQQVISTCQLAESFCCFCMRHIGLCRWVSVGLLFPALLVLLCCGSRYSLVIVGPLLGQSGDLLPCHAGRRALLGSRGPCAGAGLLAKSSSSSWCICLINLVQPEGCSRAASLGCHTASVPS